MTPQTILILLCAAAAVLLLIRLSIGGYAAPMWEAP